MSYKAFSFILMNLRQMLLLPKIKVIKIKDDSISGCEFGDVSSITSLFMTHEGRRMSLIHQVLILFFGSRICFVARRGNSVVAFDLYYFNGRDIEERTIHEGYIGVHPEHLGKGIGTRLRFAAARHFAQAGFRGLSSVVAVDNQASLRSALNAGFLIQETFTDAASGRAKRYLRLPIQETDQ